MNTTRLREIEAMLSRGDAGGAKQASEALVRSDGTAEAYRMLAIVESQAGQTEPARNAIAKALEIKPDDPVSLNVKGALLARMGRFQDALEPLEKACRLFPRFVPALVNRGNVRLDLGRPADAVASFDAALAAAPGVPDILFQRGVALTALGRNAQASQDFSAVLSRNPRHIGALLAQAELVRQSGQTAEALRLFDAALALDPANIEALKNSATLLHQMGRLAAASLRYETMIAILRPRRPLPDVLEKAFDYALGMTVSCRRTICAWDGLPALEAELVTRVRDHGATFKPFLSLMITDDMAVQSLCARRSWEARFGAAPAPLVLPARRGGARLRVGYLSADFRNHPTTWLITGLIEAHDRTRFDIFGYSAGPDDESASGRRIRKAFDTFTDISGLSDRDAAAKIAGDGVDILVDLSGLSEGARGGVLAYRPAPVTAHYLGYPGPLGSRLIDCFIADAAIIPPQDEPYYDSTIVRLPGCYQVNDRRRAQPAATPTRRDAGLPDGKFVLCGFAQPVKLSPAVFDVWMRILGRAPDSVLWLLDSDAEAKKNLLKEAATRHIDPARLIFAPLVGQEAHMARHGLADLLLDTWPCGAHTTASDALWSGVPVITAPGRSLASRVAADLLLALDVAELIMPDPVAYEDMAVALATVPAQYADVRRKVRDGRHTSALFNTDQFRRTIEQAYADMWQTRIRQKAAPE